MEQILLAYGLPRETVAAIMMQYKNPKLKVRSSDEDTDYFDILACMLQEDMAWTATVGYQSYGSQTWQIKNYAVFFFCFFFSSGSRADTALWMHFMDTN